MRRGFGEVEGGGRTRGLRGGVRGFCGVGCVGKPLLPLKLGYISKGFEVEEAGVELVCGIC